MTTIGRAALEAALAASELDVDNTANAFVSKLLADLKDDELQDDHLDVDFSETSWDSILQDIVRRSSTLRYVSAVSSFTCSRMRPGGFGGAVVVISADAILGKSTTDLLEEFIEQVALGAIADPSHDEYGGVRRRTGSSDQHHMHRYPTHGATCRPRDACSEPHTSHRPPDTRCVVSCLGAAHLMSTGKPFPLRRKAPRVTADAQPRPAASPTQR